MRGERVRENGRRPPLLLDIDAGFMKSRWGHVAHAEARVARPAPASRKLLIFHLGRLGIVDRPRHADRDLSWPRRAISRWPALGSITRSRNSLHVLRFVRVPRDTNHRLLGRGRRNWGWQGSQVVGRGMIRESSRRFDGRFSSYELRLVSAAMVN